MMEPHISSIQPRQSGSDIYNIKEDMNINIKSSNLYFVHCAFPNPVKEHLAVYVLIFITGYDFIFSVLFVDFVVMPGALH